MLILTLIYSSKWESINENLKEIQDLLSLKNIEIRYCENNEGKTVFLKVYSKDASVGARAKRMFTIYLSNYLYKLSSEEFYNKYLEKVINDSYFFMDKKEIKKIRSMIKEVIINEGYLIDESSIYYMNRKNEITSKIVEFIQNNDEFNLDGFMTFRIKEFLPNYEKMVDKIIEKYMVQKEYSEFVKLLKYFVDIQDYKIDEVNIVIDKEGNYKILNKKGEDILSEFLIDLSNTKFSGIVAMDDIIISGLITNVPKRIVIHGSNNCKNKELIQTIKNVFLERVAFCNNCSFCNKETNPLKI